MNINYQEKDNDVHVTVIDDIVRSTAELDDMKTALNTRPRPELAEYYGSMGGSDLLGPARLNLVGYQIVSAQVSGTGTGTKIDLVLGRNPAEKKAPRKTSERKHTFF
jgi:hypothetical protein